MTRWTINGGQILASGLATVIALPCFGVELAGQVSVEHRQFFQSGLQGQHLGQSALLLQPEFYWQQAEGNGRFTFTPFYRLDS